VAISPGETRRQKQIGFTLIELLVVIAIIAILAAILFPVFLAAKRMAKQSQCIENCRELSKACVLYADDHMGVGIPDGAWGGWTYSSDLAASPLFKYIRSGVRSGAITCCPCDDRKSNALQAGGVRRWSITYNGYLSKSGWGPLIFDGTHYALFTNASKLPMWVCESTDPSESPTPVNDCWFCNYDTLSSRHNGFGAIAFLDGHARMMRGGKIRQWMTAKWDPSSTSVYNYIFHPGRAAF